MEAHLSSRHQRDLLTLNGIERVLLAADEVNGAREKGIRDERIQQVLYLISRQYSQPLTVESLAQQLFLSPSRLAHLFKSQMGRSLMQHVEEYRLERAVSQLLTTSKTIEEVARSVGFPNALHFSTRFRRQYGRSPSQYRRDPKV